MTRADFLPALARAGFAHVKATDALLWPPQRKARVVVVREGIARGMRPNDIAPICGMTPDAVRLLARRHNLGAFPSHKPGRADVPTITPSPRRTLLLADDRPGIMHRRRRHCSNLGACEDAWIADQVATTGSAVGQARCPVACSQYTPRPEVFAPRIGSTHNATLSGG